MGFKTLHPDNSIYQVRMAVHTGGPLAETERKQLTSEAQKGWLNILPRVDVAQVINVQLQANDPAVLQQQPVMALAPTVYGQYGMDGTPILRMELNNNTVALTSTRYSRWDAVSGKFYKLLTMLGRVVPEGHPFRKVSSVELTYIDRLGWEGEWHGIQAEQAVQEKYLPEDRKPEEMWHCEQGWTTKEPDGVNIMEKWNVARVNRPGHGGRRLGCSSSQPQCGASGIAQETSHSTSTRGTLTSTQLTPRRRAKPWAKSCTDAPSGCTEPS